MTQIPQTPAEPLTVKQADTAPLADTVRRIALDAYAVSAGATNWQTLADVLDISDSAARWETIAEAVVPFVATLAAWRAEIGVLRDLARSYTREVADIAKALGFAETDIAPSPADLLERIAKLDVSPAFPEYEIRHPNGTTVERDDIGDAVEFRDQLWPKATIHRRSVVLVRSEWAEVTVQDLADQGNGGGA